MVRRLEQSVETVAGGDFCLLSSQIIKFIKNQASKLNNHKMSEKIMAGEKFHLIAMTTNTSAVCVNYRLDTNDVSAIKETSHTVCLSFNQSFVFFNVSTVHQQQLVLLLAAAMATALDPSHNLASERSSIESTYELTKYLEYQLKEIKDIYVSIIILGYNSVFYNFFHGNVFDLISFS